MIFSNSISRVSDYSVLGISNFCVNNSRIKIPRVPFQFREISPIREVDLIDKLKTLKKAMLLGATVGAGTVAILITKAPTLISYQI